MNRKLHLALTFSSIIGLAVSTGLAGAAESPETSQDQTNTESPSSTTRGTGTVIIEVVGALVELTPHIINGIQAIAQDSDKYHSLSDTFIFFEGNDCTQEIAGSLWSGRQGGGNVSLNIKKDPMKKWMDNDEARSVLIQNGKAGDVLKVWDSPEGHTDDDYGTLRVTTDFPDNNGYCLASFETNWVNQGVEYTVHRDDGIDGKISRVQNY
jgi:hypothetical protein